MAVLMPVKHAMAGGIAICSADVQMGQAQALRPRQHVTNANRDMDFGEQTERCADFVQKGFTLTGVDLVEFVQRDLSMQWQGLLRAHSAEPIRFLLEARTHVQLAE